VVFDYRLKPSLTTIESETRAGRPASRNALHRHLFFHDRRLDVAESHSRASVPGDQVDTAAVDFLASRLADGRAIWCAAVRDKNFGTRSVGRGLHDLDLCWPGDVLVLLIVLFSSPPGLSEVLCHLHHL